MFNLIFEILTDPLGLPINALWEYLILAIINVVAFKIGWDASPGGTRGSAIHWAVRLVAFVIIWAVTYGIIALAKRIFANWVIALCIIIGIIMLSIVIVIVINRNSERR